MSHSPGSSAERIEADLEADREAEQLDPLVLAVAACPRPHHTRLVPDDPTRPSRFHCPTCGLSFPVRGGIPVLLEAAAIAGAGQGDA